MQGMPLSYCKSLVQSKEHNFAALIVDIHEQLEILEIICTLQLFKNVIGLQSPFHMYSTAWNSTLKLGNALMRLLLRSEASTSASVSS
jgi:hypothetical protein